jgi:hypothetical protein
MLNLKSRGQGLLFPSKGHDEETDQGYQGTDEKIDEM